MSMFKKILLSTVLLVCAFGVTVGAFSMLVSAQIEHLPQWAQDRLLEQQRQVDPSVFKTQNPLEMAYSDDKSGCGNKARFFYAISLQYEQGKQTNEIVPFVMFQPVVEDIYKNIRENGIQKATLNTMEEFDECVGRAAPASNPGKEYDLQLQYGGCYELNKVILDAVDALQGGGDITHLSDEMMNNPIDLEGSAYEGQPEIPILLLSRLSKMSQNGVSQENIVRAAFQMSIGCLM